MPTKLQSIIADKLGCIAGEPLATSAECIDVFAGHMPVEQEMSAFLAQVIPVTSGRRVVGNPARP
jgi:hypothetical protein